jgi:uncharacterized membrane protein YfcA
MTIWWLAYPLLGMFAGFIAGLFGIGGGLTLVPLLVMLFSAQGFPQEQIMHLALGTAMGTIVFTSIGSMRAHHRHGAVRWDIVKSLAPGMVLGTLASSSLLVGRIQTKPLAIAFAIAVCYATFQMIADFTPKSHRTLPGPLGLFLVGLGVGVIASLVAAGGGFIIIPFLLMCNVVIYQALGTSSALGFPIAVAGSIGYLIAGWGAPNLPPYALSFIYLPALIGIAVFSMTFAPLGAKVTHSLPVKPLKRLFGGFLALLAIKMVYGLFT